MEKITGVSAHSLRAWEKRYNALIPHRTDTNIRYYDDDQVRKLLNIATLLSHGHKISKLMASTDAEIHDLIFSLEDHEVAGDSWLNVQINRLITSMISFDERGFNTALAASIRKLGMFDAMINIVYPFLRRTGLLWSTDNATPAQEHFASSLLRRKIQAAINDLSYPLQTDLNFLLFLPPGEQHEIGLLFSDYIIRCRATATVYLGQDVPYASLKMAMEKIMPSYLITFFATGADISAHLEQLILIMHRKKCTLLICSSTRVPTHVKLPKNIHFLDRPLALFDYLP